MIATKCGIAIYIQMQNALNYNANDRPALNHFIIDYVCIAFRHYEVYRIETQSLRHIYAAQF